MSSFDNHELENKLYEQITAYLAPVPPTDEPKVSGIDGVKIQIAERLVLKFPRLGLDENKRALLMAVELKFRDLKEVILVDEQDRQETDVRRGWSESNSLSLLCKMGVISNETHARADRRGHAHDDDIPF